MKLYDNWNTSGTDLDQFRVAMKEIDDKTVMIQANTAELSLLREGYESGNVKNMSLVTYDSVKELNDTMFLETANKRIPLDRLDKKLVAETLGGAGFFLVYKGTAYYMSDRAMGSLLDRANLSGDAMFRRSVARDAMLVEGLYKSGIGERANGMHDAKNKKGSANCTLVVRKEVENGNVYRKIFYVPSEKYCPVPMQFLAEIAEKICDDDKMGEPEVRYWYADHGMSEIVIAFPEKGKELKDAYGLKDAVIPGVLIRSSDTGKSCVEVKGVAFIEGKTRYMTLEAAKRRHYGDIDEGKILDEANELILRNYRVLPELLAKLIGVPVSDFDLSKAAGVRKNASRITNIVRKLMKGIKLTNIIGKKKEMAIRDLIITELNPEIPYTLYDIALAVMSLGDRINGVSSIMRDSIAAACTDVPYLLIKMVEEENIDEIYLGEDEASC